MFLQDAKNNRNRVLIHFTIYPIIKFVADLKDAMCSNWYLHFSAEYAALRCKSTRDWLARNQDNFIPHVDCY